MRDKKRKTFELDRGIAWREHLLSKSYYQQNDIILCGGDEGTSLIFSIFISNHIDQGMDQFTPSPAHRSHIQPKQRYIGVDILK